jgi:PST family polysaccharide transporter
MIIESLDGPALWFNAQTTSRYAVLATAISRITMALLRLALIYASARLITFVTATAVEPALAVCILLILYRIRGGHIAQWRFDPTLARTLIRRGFPLMLASLATAVLMRVGVVMVEHLAGPPAAGIYVGAARMVDTCGLMAANLIASISPTLISIRSRSRERYIRAVGCLFQAVSVAMTTIALAFCLVSDQLVGVIFGPAFAETAGVLRIYAWSAPFAAFGLVQVQWLVNEGYERFVLVRSIVGAVVNIAGNLILVPRYGASGAAYSVVLAQFVSCVLMNLAGDARTRRIFVLQLRALLWLDLGRLLAPGSVRPEG